MSASVDLQSACAGDYTYRASHHPAGTLADHPEEYASFTIRDDGGSEVTLYFSTREQAAALAAAALGMFPAAAPGGAS